MQRELSQMPIERASDIITVLNSGEIIHYESSSIEQVLGYEPGELVGKSLLEFIHPDDLPRVTNAFNGGLQIPGCVVSLDFRFQHKDGSWCDLEVLAQNLTDNPAIVRIVLSSRDVTG